MKSHPEHVLQTKSPYNGLVRLAVFFLCCVSAQAGWAQAPDLGSWNSLQLKYTLNAKWSVFGEGQLRSLKFYTHFHYYEYKAGLNFTVHKQLKLGLGVGSYQTYKEGGNFVLPKNNNELRIWPQVILTQSIGKVAIEQRMRTELRFTSAGYRNRFRYRVGLSLPLGKEKNDFHTYTVHLSNELFFTDNEPYFERNRILAALNYKPSKTLTVQLGYLHQFDYKINDETGRDFLVIGLYYDLFRKATAVQQNDSEIRED